MIQWISGQQGQGTNSTENTEITSRGTNRMMGNSPPRSTKREAQDPANFSKIIEGVTEVMFITSMTASGPCYPPGWSSSVTPAKVPSRAAKSKLWSGELLGQVRPSTPGRVWPAGPREAAGISEHWWSSAAAHLIDGTSSESEAGDGDSVDSRRLQERAPRSVERTRFLQEISRSRTNRTDGYGRSPAATGGLSEASWSATRGRWSRSIATGGSERSARRAASRTESRSPEARTNAP